MFKDSQEVTSMLTLGDSLEPEHELLRVYSTSGPYEIPKFYLVSKVLFINSETGNWDRMERIVPIKVTDDILFEVCLRILYYSPLAKPDAPYDRVSRDRSPIVIENGLRLLRRDHFRFISLAMRIANFQVPG